jgi:hypothetical protein
MMRDKDAAIEMKWIVVLLHVRTVPFLIRERCQSTRLLSVSNFIVA